LFFFFCHAAASCSISIYGSFWMVWFLFQIVGDLHGQHFDLLNLLNVGGWPPATSYIFMGDFVDRGHNSVETLSLLLCLKLKYPGHVTLLRGNHEVREREH
jgi:hypothetical protein